MKKELFTSLLLLCMLPVNAQKDIIMKRDGSEMTVKIIQVGPNRTTYKMDDKKKSGELFMDNSDIYMIKYEKRGNVFFSESGERFLGKEQKVYDDDIVIYLKSGDEIVAYDLQMDTQKIVFNDGKGKKAAQMEIPKSKVFMIKYPDGTKDILNEFQSQQGISNETRRPQLKKEEKSEQRLLAIIKTHNNAKIEALVVDEKGGVISFYREGEPYGPLYQITRDKIESMEYVQ